MFLAFLHIGWSISLVWVPVLIATMVLLCLGIGMMVSAASLFFRDVKYIVEIFLTFGIFFTPVFYARPHVRRAWQVADAKSGGSAARWAQIPSRVTVSLTFIGTFTV